MARQIDFDNLSDEDYAYIAQRPWMVRDAKFAGYDIEDKVNEMLTSTPEGAGTVVLTTESLSAGAPDPSKNKVELENPDEGDDYDEWKKPELVAEADSRGLDSGGVMADLISRLRDWDQENS